jgi:pyruvate dehydrogenase E2 component (dihydrolipoamide acetyltransferase)
MEEGTVAKWHKKEGDFVQAGDLLLEIATDKATLEHTALDEGWLRKIIIQEGKTAAVNQPIAIFTVDEKESLEGYPHKDVAPEPAKKAEEEIKTVKEEEVKLPTERQAAPFSQPAFMPEPPLEMVKVHGPQQQGRPRASPLARRLAKNKGLDLSTVKGTGPGGRITSKDLVRAQPAGLVTFGRVEFPTNAPGTYEEVPLTPMRKAIARRLQESKSFIPHFYVRQVINAEPLVLLREQLKSFNLHVTYNDMIVKGCALALREHPKVNAGFNTVNQTLVYFKTIDISIAVNIEDGLITPIVRHADFKNLGELSVEIKQLAERARHMKLKEQEYKGGSFCVSNLGMFGVSEFAAVINPPQAAILAIGSIEDRPIIKEGKVVPGKTLTLTLSADHRVVDGALAAQFIKTLQKILENPVALTL